MSSTGGVESTPQNNSTKQEPLLGADLRTPTRNSNANLPNEACLQVNVGQTHSLDVENNRPQHEESELHSYVKMKYLAANDSPSLSSIETDQNGENGQRCYGPPVDWQGPAPERGCEVFVGRIPRDCLEDELVPIFSQIGPVYQFRLMMDFSGANRGYGFCTFTSPKHARMAVQRLDNWEIRPDKWLGVCPSVDNCRLFVGGIPKTKNRDEILREMVKVTDGVRDVIVYPSVADKSKNRGFAFVEYDSHKAAAMARRKLLPGKIQLWNQQIAVDWAEPEREVDESIMQKVKILYVRNLMLSTTEDVLRDLFNIACESSDAIERVKKMRDYAFIHFRERRLADMAMQRMHNTEIEGSRVEVSFAKPVDKSEHSNRGCSAGSSNNNAGLGGISPGHFGGGRNASNRMDSFAGVNGGPLCSPMSTSQFTNNGGLSNASSVGAYPMQFYLDPLFYSSLLAAAASTTNPNSAAGPGNLGVGLDATVASLNSGILGLGGSGPSMNTLISCQGNNNNRPNRVYRNAAGSRSAGSRSNIPGYQRDRKSNDGFPGAVSPTINHVEILEDWCLRNNFGIPLFSTTPHELFDPVTNQAVIYHLGQVSLPQINQHYMAPSLALSVDEAKQTAARSVLTLFQLQIQSQSLDTAVAAATLSLLQQQLVNPVSNDGSDISTTANIKVDSSGNVSSQQQQQQQQQLLNNLYAALASVSGMLPTGSEAAPTMMGLNSAFDLFGNPLSSVLPPAAASSLAALFQPNQAQALMSGASRPSPPGQTSKPVVATTPLFFPVQSSVTDSGHNSGHKMAAQTPAGTAPQTPVDNGLLLFDERRPSFDLNQSNYLFAVSNSGSGSGASTLSNIMQF